MQAPVVRDAREVAAGIAVTLARLVGATHVDIGVLRRALPQNTSDSREAGCAVIITRIPWVRTWDRNVAHF